MPTEYFREEIMIEYHLEISPDTGSRLKSLKGWLDDGLMSYDEFREKFLDAMDKELIYGIPEIITLFTGVKK